MLLISGTELGQNFAEVRFFKFDLHYQKCYLVIYCAKFFKIKVLLIFRTKSGLKVPEVIIVKFSVQYQKQCHVIINLAYFH